MSHFTQAKKKSDGENELFVENSIELINGDITDGWISTYYVKEKLKYVDVLTDYIDWNFEH